MSEEDKSQKTEQPTQHKLTKAREQGNVFTSKEVNNFLSLLVISLCIILLGNFFVQSLKNKLEKFFISPHKISYILSSYNLMYNTMIDIFPFIIIPPIITMIINILSLTMQHGFIYSTDVIQPKLERISLFAGFKRIFSLNSVVELIKNLIKIIAIGSIIYYVITKNIIPLINTYQLSIVGSLALFMSTLLKLFIGILCLLFCIASIDYLYQKYVFINKMKMTKQEVKDEYKDQEGNPEVKHKLKAMRIKMSKRRVQSVVPKADVVITNPTHYAVALEFKIDKMDTPVVIAKGQDDIALYIRDIARKHNISIVENPPLARALFAEINVGMKITTKYYKAVADIIAYIMKLKNKKYTK